MTTESLVTVTTIAVAIAAIAIVAMAAMVFSMFKAVTTIRDQVQVFLPKAESLVTTATQTITDNQLQIKGIISNASQIVETAHKDVTRLDGFVEDATTRAKVQLERLELVMDDTVERVHHTVVMLNNTVLKPVREVSGVASGVKAAVRHLMRSNRPTPAQATSDEEMFI